MNRTLSGRLAGPLAGLGLAIVIGACGDHHHHDDWGGGSAAEVDCSAYSSCESCTPVVGCGWCFSAAGDQACSAAPTECQGDSWTWDPSGCTVLARPTVAADSDGGVD